MGIYCGWVLAAVLVLPGHLQVVVLVDGILLLDGFVVSFFCFLLFCVDVGSVSGYSQQSVTLLRVLELNKLKKES